MYLSGPPRESCKAGTRLLWGPGDMLRLLYKLRIRVENTKNKKYKNKNEASMDKAMGPFRNSLTPFWLSRSQTDVPAELSSHRLWYFFLKLNSN